MHATGSTDFAHVWAELTLPAGQQTFDPTERRSFTLEELRRRDLELFSAGCRHIGRAQQQLRDELPDPASQKV